MPCILSLFKRLTIAIVVESCAMVRPLVRLRYPQRVVAQYVRLRLCGEFERLWCNHVRNSRLSVDQAMQDVQDVRLGPHASLQCCLNRGQDHVLVVMQH
ncbi:hypothetical protein D3C87_1770930 [compost metagenome]